MPEVSDPKVTLLIQVFRDLLFIFGHWVTGQWDLHTRIVGPVWMRRLSCTCKGTKALLARPATLSCNSLWQVVTGPPLLQHRAWAIGNCAPYP